MKKFEEKSVERKETQKGNAQSFLLKRKKYYKWSFGSGFKSLWVVA